MKDVEITKPPPPEPREPAAREDETVRPRQGSLIGLAFVVSLIALAGIGGGWPLLVIIFAIVLMIFLHELGHFLTAKWAGMKVTEFFIGFGPRIWSFRRGETEYGIKAIWLGAYVRIVGMNVLDEVDPADTGRTYMSKPYWRRLSVALAGSTMHFLMAFVGLFVLFAFVGVPIGDDQPGWTVDTVTPASGAQEAGIRPGDRIVQIDGVPIGGFDQFGEVVKARPDETVPVVIERDGSRTTVQVHIGDQHPQLQERVGFFGISSRSAVETLGLGESVKETFVTFGRGSRLVFEGLGRILSPTGFADLGQRVVDVGDDPGPAVNAPDGGVDPASDDANRPLSVIGISRIGAQLLEEGWGPFINLFVSINLFVGIFNLIPLLPFDGGHVAIATYEKIRSAMRGGAPYHADVARLLPLTYAVVLMIVFLGLSTVYLDLLDPIDLGG